jgi:radical SAM-linked protein
MRVRITFSKTGALRYIGHLDLNTIWERAARRAGLPLAYSQGFHPQPKMYFASALPLGFSSQGEVVEIRFNEDIDLTTLSEQLQNAMPSGIGILKAESMDDHAPPLQTQIVSAEYEVTLTETSNGAELKQKLDEVMASESLPRQRRGKSYDLRPLIEELALTPVPLVPSAKNSGPSAGHSPQIQRILGELEGGFKIFMRLAAREGATGRPDEVLDVLGITIEKARVERTCLIFKS